MSKSGDLQNLVSAMNGQPTTNGWDIVCSYNLIQLQSFLNKKYSATALAKAVEISAPVTDPLTLAKYTIEYNINFASPELSFIAGEPGNVTLTLPITSGSYSIIPSGQSTPSQKVTLPANKYSVQGTYPLAALQGLSGPLTPQNNVIEFSETATDTYSIILDFNSKAGTQFKIVPAPEPGDADKDPMETYFLPVFQNYFTDNITDIDLALTAVTNADPNQSKVFSPKSFVFRSEGDESNGVLSIYIQTLQSGNDPGDPNPAFQPGGVEWMPIPTGNMPDGSPYSASVIFSYNFMSLSILQPQLKSAGYGVTFLAEPFGGLSAQLSQNVSITSLDDSGQSWFSGHDYPGVNISLNTFPLVMTIANGTISLSFSGNCNNISWDETAFSGMGYNPGQNGTVDVAISMNKGSYPITISEDNANMNFPPFDLQTSDFKITVSSHSCAWYETMFGGCSTDYPTYYSQLPIRIPSLDIHQCGVNFFSDTNLLTPNTQVLALDARAGVQTPHDFIVVGKVLNS